MSLPVNLDADDSPGLLAALAAVEENILVAARARFSKNIEIARFLKLSKGNTSVRISRLRAKETAGVSNLIKNRDGQEGEALQ